MTEQPTKEEQVPLSADAVVERLCRLQSEVHDKLGANCAADCFCRKGGFWGGETYDGAFENGYRNDGRVLEFIEQAVREKLMRTRKQL